MVTDTVRQVLDQSCTLQFKVVLRSFPSGYLDLPCPSTSRVQVLVRIQ